MQYLTHIWTARILIIVGFLAGWTSIGATVLHIGNDLFLLTENAPLTPTHAWHHYFRELGGDFGAMAAVLVIVFATPQYRTPIA
jgi:hypothetical protein